MASKYLKSLASTYDSGRMPCILLRLIVQFLCLLHSDHKRKCYIGESRQACLFEFLESPLCIDINSILCMLSLKTEVSESCVFLAREALDNRGRGVRLHTILNLCFKVCGAYFGRNVSSSYHHHKRQRYAFPDTYSNGSLPKPLQAHYARGDCIVGQVGIAQKDVLRPTRLTRQC